VDFKHSRIRKRIYIFLSEFFDWLMSQLLSEIHMNASRVLIKLSPVTPDGDFHTHHFCLPFDPNATLIKWRFIFGFSCIYEYLFLGTNAAAPSQFPDIPADIYEISSLIVAPGDAQKPCQKVTPTWGKEPENECELAHCQDDDLLICLWSSSYAQFVFFCLFFYWIYLYIKTYWPQAFHVANLQTNPFI